MLDNRERGLRVIVMQSDAIAGLWNADYTLLDEVVYLIPNLLRILAPNLTLWDSNCSVLVPLVFTLQNRAKLLIQLISKHKCEINYYNLCYCLQYKYFVHNLLKR